ncbi:MAG: hypothetical protein AB7Q81_12225 [Gammaproteobacteria bacterium]
MDILKNYFAEHLDDADVTEHPSERVLRMESLAARYLLFRVGQLRFALASTDVAAVTREPERNCEYLSAAAIVPPRYQAAARVDASHASWVHLAGTRFGLGPCRADGDVVLTNDDITARGERGDAPWIIGTIAEPPSLVLDRDLVCARLLTAATA